MSSSIDYKRTYETAKQELADLIAAQDKLGKRIVVLREFLGAIGKLCESEEIEIEPSQEAAYLLENTALIDEIRAILRSRYPGWQRPHQVWKGLHELGRDLSEYANPQAAVHMVLKRLYESGEVQEASDADGKKIYRCPPMWQAIRDALLKEPAAEGKARK